MLDSLKICSYFASGSKKATDGAGGDRKIEIHSRFFSDSIVFFLKEKPEDIGHLFLIIRYIQDELWYKGLLIRGAITYGDMLFPIIKEKNITLGPGVIDAYELESKIAIYPRIVISRNLYDYIKQEDIKSYPFAEEGNLKDYIKQDNDGIYFLDLLNKNIIRKKSEQLKPINIKKDSFSIEWNEQDGQDKYDEVIESLKQCIENNINSKDNKIRQKYEWLKFYKESTLDEQV
ncbi:hypothetical protein J7L67_06410 [bacterium]|nr:hypothetical protein [bacterium]